MTQVKSGEDAIASVIVTFSIAPIYVALTLGCIVETHSHSEGCVVQQACADADAGCKGCEFGRQTTETTARNGEHLVVNI